MRPDEAGTYACRCMESDTCTFCKGMAIAIPFLYHVYCAVSCYQHKCSSVFTTNAHLPCTLAQTYDALDLQNLHLQSLPTG